MKKKIILLAVATITLMACDSGDVPVPQKETKDVRFSVEGDFMNYTFSRIRARNVLSANGSEMKDLYVIDYMGAVHQQTVHQTSEDEAFGTPAVSLAYGSHTLYFIASRGENPTVDVGTHTITWDNVRDTFLGSVSIDVSSSTSTEQTVTLDRCCTKVKVNIKDEVPEGISEIRLQPATWYFGIDYLTGEAVNAQTVERVIEVPTNYVGTSNLLSVSLFSISGSSEWTTDMTVKAVGVDDEILGSVTIRNAPFKTNRATEYTGSLFNAKEGFGISLSDEWLPSYSDTW